MMHTSGLIYGSRGNTAVHKLYPGSSSTAGATMDGAEFMDELAKLPLLNHPGAVWDYGFGLDVLGQVGRESVRAEARASTSRRISPSRSA